MSEITERALSALQVVDEETTHEKMKRALIKRGHKEEEQKINDGWKYVNITPTFRILVPCDKNGKPTKEGMEKIERRKKSLAIY